MGVLSPLVRFEGGSRGITLTIAQGNYAELLRLRGPVVFW